MKKNKCRHCKPKKRVTHDWDKMIEEAKENIEEWTISLPKNETAFLINDVEHFIPGHVAEIVIDIIKKYARKA